MNVVLFTWNPDKWEIGEREWSRNIRQVVELGAFYGRWSTGKTTFIKQGDLALLLRQSRDRGIVARGTVISDIYQEESWDEDDDEGAMSSYVDISWTEILPIDKRLTIETLKEKIPDVSWVPFSSGTTVKPAFHRQLLDLWDETVADAGLTNRTAAAPRSTTSGSFASTELIVAQNGSCGLCGLDPVITYSRPADGLFRTLQFPGSSGPLAVCPTCAGVAGLPPAPGSADEFRRQMSAQH